MKKITLAAALALCMGLVNAQEATAASCELAVCATNIALDAGVTGKNCYDNYLANGDCECGQYALDRGWCMAKLDTTGGTGWTRLTDGFGGLRCYGKNRACGPSNMKTEDYAELDAILSTIDTSSSSNNAQLEEIFGDVPRVSDTTQKYFGYANAELRSPSTGRNTLPEASLDSCLGHTDVAAIPGTNNYDKWVNCKGGSYGCEVNAKNEYCRATGTNDGATVSAAVCKDRCDCVYGYGTCGNQ